MSDEKPDFEALRKERNARVADRVAQLAFEHGVPERDVFTSFNPAACYCACGTGGPCEHDWRGPGHEFEDGSGWTATCARCGATAISHAMRFDP